MDRCPGRQRVAGVGPGQAHLGTDGRAAITIWNLPWLEIALVVSLIGSLWVNRFRDPFRAFLWGLVFTGAVLACTLLAWVGFVLGPPGGGIAWSAQRAL